MSKYIYLFRNNDLYIIGSTDNLKKEKEEMRPAILEAVVHVKNPRDTINLLYSKYAKCRLPKTNYFRLSRLEAEECYRAISEVRGLERIKPFFTGINLIATFILIWILTSLFIIKFGIGY